jgi:hypothetical protein
VLTLDNSFILNLLFWSTSEYEWNILALFCKQNYGAVRSIKFHKNRKRGSDVAVDLHTMLQCLKHIVVALSDATRFSVGIM